MKIIDHNMIQSVEISPIDAYHWVEHLLKEKTSIVLPPKISMHQDGHIFYNVMPCILPDENCMGVKVITRHPEKIHGPTLTSQILLYELSSGQLLSILDGSYITALRTGAVTAHSVQLFANPGFKSMGIIGLGITATATMDILCAIAPHQELTVHLLRYKEQERRFFDRYKHHKNLHFVFHDTAESVIRSSEVIVSCVTVAEENFAKNDDYLPGCVVLPVHSMGFQNCDIFFDKVFADDINHVSHFKNFNQFQNLSEVSSVVRGENTGRDYEQQRILVYNIGLSIHDIYFANRILSNFSDLPDIHLDGPAEKMWL